MVVEIRVGVAIAYPPSLANTRYVRVIVEADTETKARLLACQTAASTPIPGHGLPIMPVSDQILAILEL